MLSFGDLLRTASVVLNVSAAEVRSMTGEYGSADDCYEAASDYARRFGLGLFEALAYARRRRGSSVAPASKANAPVVPQVSHRQPV